MEFFFNSVFTYCGISCDYGALMSIILQTFLPISSVLLVAGYLICANLLAISTSTSILIIKGVHLEEVHWLSL